jgi:hypothetical protein
MADKKTEKKMTGFEQFIAGISTLLSHPTVTKLAEKAGEVMVVRAEIGMALANAELARVGATSPIKLKVEVAFAEAELAKAQLEKAKAERLLSDFQGGGKKVESRL